ncbi:receptor-like protein kinase ANXUR2 isoform X2 [Salvia divinorum]|uniref:Receptor-like protein kinase ANXUR2 isoform X2 n=1 Tax=Salvia divinorum TaxID=28513 RepID=A0ABD1GFK5_SALDI
MITFLPIAREAISLSVLQSGESSVDVGPFTLWLLMLDRKEIILEKLLQRWLQLLPRVLENGEDATIERLHHMIKHEFISELSRSLSMLKHENVVELVV